MAEEQLAHHCNVVACGPVEVRPSFPREHCVRPATVLFGLGSLDEAGPLQSIDQAARATVGENTLGGERLNAQAPPTDSRKTKKDLVLRVSEAKIAPQIVLEESEETALCRDKAVPGGGLGLGEEVGHVIAESTTPAEPSSG